MTSIRSPQGTKDVFDPESEAYLKIMAIFVREATKAGFGFYLGPLFEDPQLYRLSAGEMSDVVRKEMYRVIDKNGKEWVLRPEGTASVCRAFIENNPLLPVKAFYITPAFRYERPQKGRLRQHHQLGLEYLGVASSFVEIDLLLFSTQFLNLIGVSEASLHLNSLGDDVCRPGFLAELKAFLGKNKDELCEEHQGRYLENPLRVLDCKKASCVSVSEESPDIFDYLCVGCKEHFECLTRGLDALSITYIRDKKLARGFDYYSRTIFEYRATSGLGSQDAIGGGGRYDRLIGKLGGSETPGAGLAFGLERLVLSSNSLNHDPRKVSLIDLSQDCQGLQFLARIRKAGFHCDLVVREGSLKSKMRLASRTGAKIVVIVGEQELRNSRVVVRNLESSTQESVFVEELESYLKQWLKTKSDRN